MSINTSYAWYEDVHFILASEAQQVLYLNDYKLGHEWKVVQKVQLRHLWDIPEIEDVDEEVEAENFDPMADNDAYQQDEFNDIQQLVQEDNLENRRLHQEDIEPEVIASNVENYQWMDEGRVNDFICDDIEEDDTDDGDNEEITPNDDDSD